MMYSLTYYARTLTIVMADGDMVFYQIQTVRKHKHPLTLYIDFRDRFLDIANNASVKDETRRIIT